MRQCSIENCIKKHSAKGYCRNHYWAYKQYGNPLVSIRERHGISKTYIYHAWVAMKARCRNLGHPAYPYYGGRGIKVYEEWIESFTTFYNYVGDRPSRLHSLDRKNNDGHYEPGNVHWATKKEQSLNTRLRSTNKTGYRGVCYDKKRSKYLTTIKDKENNYQMNLGLSSTAEEAALKYDTAAIQIFGELAHPNLL